VSEAGACLDLINTALASPNTRAAAALEFMLEELRKPGAEEDILTLGVRPRVDQVPELFSPGERVLARRDDGPWYPAEVLRYNGMGAFEIRWEHPKDPECGAGALRYPEELSLPRVEPWPELEDLPADVFERLCRDTLRRQLLQQEHLDAMGWFPQWECLAGLEVWGC